MDREQLLQQCKSDVLNYQQNKPIDPEIITIKLEDSLAAIFRSLKLTCSTEKELRCLMLAILEQGMNKLASTILAIHAITGDL